MERNRAMAKYPLQWFYTMFERLVPQRKADILFAVKEDEYAAGVVLVYSATSNHYLHNGSMAVHLENRPNDLIVDEIIRKGVEEGKTTLDFMGSDPNDLSLLRFKEKWGSQSKDIYTYVKDYHPFRCKIWELGKRVMNSSLGSWFLRRIRG
jgi:lipid II:glycine glycyltransferase (peptidoglycan interpeptide bridge formation enzyme)